jgi:hypothetical protein
LAEAITQLLAAGVTVVAGSGNRGSTTQLNAPGCNTGVLAVGTTYTNGVGPQPPDGETYRGRFGAGFDDCRDATTQLDQIACFTNLSRELGAA